MQSTGGPNGASGGHRSEETWTPDRLNHPATGETQLPTARRPMSYRPESELTRSGTAFLPTYSSVIHSFTITTANAAHLHSVLLT